MLQRVLTVVALMALSVFATEALKPVAPPQSYIAVGGVAELRDDVYSGDLGWTIEVAPCNCFSVYTDMSYRFLSYEWDTGWSDENHDPVNLHVNGLNESFVGMKIFPIQYFGVDLSWRFLPGDGGQMERFERLGVEPMGVYPFSRNLLLGLSFQYYTFVERKNFQPGDEIGIKASFVWKFLWDRADRTGWIVDYAFLYRKRVGESENYNLAEPYQKMDDDYNGIRMKAAISYSFGWFPFPFALGFAGEMTRGYLFGFETGHRAELFIRADFP